MKAALAVMLALWCLPAHAQEASFVFMREVLTLQTEVDKTLIERELPVQVRPYRSIEETDSFNLRLGNKDGLLLFIPHGQTHIGPGNLYTPADVTVIGHDGSILQIWPNVVLSELTYALELPPGSHALLVLAGGGAETLGLKPGARIRHDWFQPQPSVLR